MNYARLDYLPGKAVCVPGCPPVDIGDFLPLVDHPLLQRLRGRKQLGVNHLVFPGAVHTRFEHTIGVLGLTRRFCQLYGVDRDTARLVCGYALLHDLGHGPFSHQIEPVLAGDHHRQGEAYLERLREPLAQCGIEAAAMLAMFRQQNHWHRFVGDRNFGTDKLDYLFRDALHIGFSGLPDIDKLALYAVFDERGWAIEEKFVEDVKRIQKFYSYLHQHGYLNKTALSIQRVFQRAVQEALAAGELSAEAVWEMQDDELTGALRSSRQPLVASLLASLGNRQFHRSVCVIKPKGYGYVERRSTKDILVREWPRDRLRDFSERVADLAAVRRLEDELAVSLGLRPGELLLAAMPFFEKLVPRDVRIFSRHAETEYSLFDNDTAHFRSLAGDYLQTFAIRIIVPPECRPAAFRQAAAIADWLATTTTPATPSRPA